MLGPFTLLPLLSGWEYKTVGLPVRTISNGAPPTEVYRVEEDGWLLDLSLVSTDAYATLHIEYQGADLETRLIRANPEGARTLGAWFPQAGGWLNRYYRPLQASTAGLYQLQVYATSGEFFPYIRTIIVKYELPSTSTQPSCSMSAGTTKIAITNKEKFILSLRNVLGEKAKEIDWTLITGGK